MAEKRASQERPRFYLRALIGFMVLLGAAGLVYLYLAFAPTGYGGFERKHAEAIARAEGLMQIRIAKPPRPAEGPRERENEKESFPSILDNAVMRGFGIDSGGGSAYSAEFQVDPLTSAVLQLPHELYGWRRSAYSAQEFPVDPLTSAVLGLPPDLLEPEMEMVKLILAEPWNQPTNVPGNDLVQRFRELDAAIKMRRLAMNSSREAVSESILHAAATGDGARACDLLEAYLDLERIGHFRGFPEEKGSRFRGAEQILILLSQMEAFPEEGFRRARDVLESACLDSDARRAFYAASVMGSRDRLVQLLEKDEIRRNANTWHYFLDGKPEAAVYHALKPAMKQRIDLLAIALVEGDRNEVLRAHERMTLVGKMLNLGERYHSRSGLQLALFCEEPTAERIGWWKGEGFNDEVDFARLILAACHYRRLEGDFPERVEDLIPDYLPPSFLPSAETTWSIRRLERFRYPAVYGRDHLEFRTDPRRLDHEPEPAKGELVYGRGHPESRTDPFSQAVARYRSEKGRPPQSPEDLRPYASGDAEFETFRGRFVWCEARPVFFRLSRRRASALSKRAGREMILVEARWPSVVLTFSAEGLPADGGRRLPPESGK